jgi:hypothetical protein
VGREGGTAVLTGRKKAGEEFQTRATVPQVAHDARFQLEMLSCPLCTVASEMCRTWVADRRLTGSSQTWTRGWLRATLL